MIRVEARIPADLHAMFKHAAKLENQTLSEFLTLAATQHAQRVIAQVEVIRFGRDASVAFSDLLINGRGPRIRLADATPLHTETFGAPE